jgi:phosphoserine phosphatase
MIDSDRAALDGQPPVWPTCDVVIFDCDSTLSRVEGIDELARLAGAQLNVAALTDRAMNGDAPLDSIYAHRLALSNPTRSQVERVRRIYRETVVADAREVIAALQGLGRKVFVVSGGLIEPVRDFGVWLGVPRERIYAVDMEYDQLAGEWWRYWEQPGGQNPHANYLAIKRTPLTGAGGKGAVIDRIRGRHPGRALLIGDGASDLEALAHVDLFVGFGGVVYRDRIAAQSPVYIRSPYLSPILPIALGRLGGESPWRDLFLDGLERIEAGEVRFRDESMRATLLAAIRR